MKMENKQLTFGSVIKGIRERRGLSVRTLAAIIEVSAAYLSDLENNKRKVTLSIMENIKDKVELTKAEEEAMMKSFSHDRLDIPVEILYYLIDNELIESMKTIKVEDQKGEAIKRLALGLKNNNNK